MIDTIKCFVLILNYYTESDVKNMQNNILNKEFARKLRVNVIRCNERGGI